MLKIKRHNIIRRSVWLCFALLCAGILGGCSIAGDILESALKEISSESLEIPFKSEETTIEMEETSSDERAAGDRQKKTDGGEGILRPELTAYEDSGSYNSLYYSEKMFDGNDATSWAGKRYKAKEAFFIIYFKEPFTISDIAITNGNWEDGETSFKRTAKLKEFTLTYDDGEKAEFLIKSSTDKYWSESIIPKTTSYVILEVKDVYMGESEDRPLAISELDFFYNPNSMFVNTDWANPAETEGAAGTKEVAGIPDYTPDWYDWAPTGYDAQDIDLENLQAGKWISRDGSTILYTDFHSSPDYMDYGILFNGEIWDENTYAGVDWNHLNASGEPYMAEDTQNGFHFSVPEPGVMEVEKAGEGIWLYLKRAKYK